MVQKIAVYLGIRTNCCGAKIETWHSNKFYCSDCHRSLSTPLKQAEPAKAVRKPKAVVRRSHIRTAV